MDKALLFFGIIIIFFGIIIFVLLLTSVINIGQSIKDQYSSIPQAEKNLIHSYALINAAIVLIGILIIKQAFKR